MGTKAPVGTIFVVGLASSGKSLLVSLLTGGDYAQTSAQKSGTKHYVKVPHHNINVLHESEGAHKELILPFIQVAEAPGLVRGDSASNAHALNVIKEATGVVAVIDRFTQNDDPAAQKQFILDQFLDEDKRIVSAQLTRAKSDLAKKPNNTQLQKIAQSLEDLANRLEKREPPKGHDAAIKDIKLLSLLPAAFVINTPENNPATQIAGDFAICLKLEYDISRLGSDEERLEFMREYRLERLSYPELARYIYTNTGHIMFFTAGDNDVTGWGIKKGSKAVEAAGVIHTDIAKGFINAEIISWSDFMKFKSIAACKQRGLVQKLPRDYIMNDSDIATFNFSPPK